MNLPRWIPRPIAWVHAIALFAFATGVSKGMALVLPLLAALMRHSPRLAWLGILTVWLSPIVLASAIHGGVERAIGRGEARSKSRASWLGGATSWWSGVLSWATIILVSVTTVFVTLVFYPPPVDSSALGSFSSALTRSDMGTLWIVLAAYVSELERAARKASG